MNDWRYSTVRVFWPAMKLAYGLGRQKMLANKKSFQLRLFPSDSGPTGQLICFSLDIFIC